MLVGVNWLMNSPRIKVIACGGTIDKVYFDAKSTFQVGEPQVVTVLRESNVAFDYEIVSLLRKDSLEMTEKDRILIREEIEESTQPKILITHGTDTMVETGKALTGIQGKTIVLTGAMEPALFSKSDAEFNIGFALAAVQTLPEGVYVAMNGRVLDPLVAKKNIEKKVFE